MSDQEQVFAFADELDKLVDRFQSEFDLTRASVVGCLMFKAQAICLQAMTEDQEEEGGGEE